MMHACVAQVENFYTKVVNDLEGELTNLDPTVPIRSVLEEHDEQKADASAEDYNTPWVMKGGNDAKFCWKKN